MTKLPLFLTNPDPYLYVHGTYLVLDFETTGLDKGSALNPQNRLLFAAWRTKGQKMRTRWGGEFDMAPLLEDIAAADFIVAHNAKFELQWLERCGLDLSTVVVYDTQIAGYVLGGNMYQSRHLSLDNMARRYKLGYKDPVVSMMIKEGVPVEDIPASWLEHYCEQDVRLTEKLYKLTVEELFNNEQLPIMYTRCLLTPALADIEKNGMFLDSEKVLPLYDEVEQEYEGLGATLARLAGGINLNSGKQLGEFLYKTLKFPEPKDRHGNPRLTPGGKLPTDADTITSLPAKTKRQKEFKNAYAKYRDLHSQLTKYLRKFRDCCEESGGHLIAQFNQTQTRTHRLSSSGAKYSTQFQNLPRIYKPLFKARKKGWHVYETDGSQLEFRVAVHLGRDKTGLEHLEKGVDIHSNTARVIRCERQEAKAHTDRKSTRLNSSHYS